MRFPVSKRSVFLTLTLCRSAALRDKGDQSVSVNRVKTTKFSSVGLNSCHRVTVMSNAAVGNKEIIVDEGHNRWNKSSGRSST